MSAAFILASGFIVPAPKAVVTDELPYSKNYSMDFKKIVVEDGINLVLKESKGKQITIEGVKNAIPKVQWKIKNNTLYLSSKKGSLKDNVIVTLDVTGLEQVEINGDSEIMSNGNLQSQFLQIYLNGTGRVSISNFGRIALYNGEGINVIVKKQTENVSISDAERN